MPVYTNVWQLVEAKLGHFLHCIITFCTLLYHQAQLAMRGKEKGKEAEQREVQRTRMNMTKRKRPWSRKIKKTSSNLMIRGSKRIKRSKRGRREMRKRGNRKRMRGLRTWRSKRSSRRSRRSRRIIKYSRNCRTSSTHSEL